MILAVLLPKVLMYVQPKVRSTQSYLNPAIFLILFIMITLAFTYYLVKRNIDTVPACKKVKAPRKAYTIKGESGEEVTFGGGEWPTSELAKSIAD